MRTGEAASPSPDGLRAAWVGVRVLAARIQGAEPAEERVWLARDSRAVAPPHQTLEEVQRYFRAVTWAWKPWIPVGHLTMLVGEQGVGKSYLAAYLMGALSGHVAAWPDGAPVDPATRPVLLLDTEEFRGVYAERLGGMGVPQASVLLPGNDPTFMPRIPADVDRIAALVQYKGCAGVIIDSLSGGHTQEENSANMRLVLQALVRMAGELRLPVMVVHHTRKRGIIEGDGFSLDRVRGSSTITQFCRSVIALHRVDADETVPTCMQCIKHSFGAAPQPLGFLITDEGLVFSGPPEPDRDRSPADRAEAYLRARLEGGAAKSARIIAEAAEMGISRSSIYRARDRLGLISTKGWWCLPDKLGL